MASINISEADFLQVAMAASDAKRRNDMEAARALDKIARKINASLTAAGSASYRYLAGGKREPLTWRDMPSTLDE